MSTLGLDISNHTGLITVEWAQQVRAAGMSFVVCGTHDPSITRNQVFCSTQAKLQADLYIWSHPNSPIQPWVQRAVDGSSGLPIRDVYIDYEEDGHPYGNDFVDLVLDEWGVVSYMLDRPTGLYTRKSWFEEHIAGASPSKVDKLSRLFVWFAQYDGLAEITPRLWREWGFGPWWKPRMKQYSDTTDFQGKGVCLDVRL